MMTVFTSSAPKSPLPLSSPGKEAGTGSSRKGASGARCAGSPPGPPHSAGGIVQSLPPARALVIVGTKEGWRLMAQAAVRPHVCMVSKLSMQHVLSAKE